MQATHQLAVVALICNLLLGAAVFGVNPRRPANRSFLLLTASICIWSAGVVAAFYAGSEAQIVWAIRVCTAAGLFFPAMFSLLRLSIIHHRETWAKHCRRAFPWIVIATVLAALCLSPWLLRSAHLVPVPGSPGHVAPYPVYVALSWRLVMFYVYGWFAALAILLVRDQFDRRIVGAQRAELQFLALGYLVVALSILIGFAFNLRSGTHQINKYGPLRFVLFTIIIAYGISSRGILNVRSALRLGLSYLLLAVYAGGVFFIAWTACGYGLALIGSPSNFWQALWAAVAVSVLVNSASTPLRRVARKILPSAELDFERTVFEVGRIVQSVATLPELLAEFSSVLCKAVGTPRVQVLLAEGSIYCEHGSQGAGSTFLRADDLIVDYFHSGGNDLATEDLDRRAPSAQQDALRSRLESLGADLIVSIRYRGALSALLLLAPRQSGRIFGSDGRATLRLISEQLGVAIANARLYTEARQSQAYNQFLVEHLPCGVIATDPAGGFSLVNPEARRLLHIDPVAAAADVELPEDISGLIAPTLADRVVARDEEVVLRAGARDQTHLRVSCLPFTNESALLGAVLVLNDHTVLDRLQREIRQADRLASIGTLASGMAHEIKNPLTALKTFAQLLPKRYNDAEFRDHFSGLVGSEIMRIERIVNQLLAFARPARLIIEPISLQDIVANVVRLITPQAARQRVTLRTTLKTDERQVAADKDMLQQVLVNLLLNALQAIDGAGWIELASELEVGTPEQAPMIRLDVRDSGRGIPTDTLPHIFDPFFTTKSEGTGLGLSVSYNIIAEHQGRLEVRSDPGEGACFSIYLPVS